jgi:hypothetical protein
MAKCPNCQRSSFFFKKVTCIVCGKRGCEKCLTFLLTIVDKYGSQLEYVHVCSKECFESLATQIENQIKASEITVENILPAYHYFVRRSIFSPSNLSKFSPKVQSYIRKKRYVGVWFRRDSSPTVHELNGLGKQFDNFVENPSNPLWLRLMRRVRLIQAKHFETLREFENAARIYRDLMMYEEAGKVRAKDKEFVVKKTDISLDLNALLQQVKDGGIVAIYRCPHCNGKLKIGNNSTLKSIKTCEHCGSEIEAVDLADFLKTALS